MLSKVRYSGTRGVAIPESMCLTAPLIGHQGSGLAANDGAYLFADPGSFAVPSHGQRSQPPTEERKVIPCFHASIIVGRCGRNSMSSRAARPGCLGSHSQRRG